MNRPFSLDTSFAWFSFVAQQGRILRPSHLSGTVSVCRVYGEKMDEEPVISSCRARSHEGVQPPWISISSSLTRRETGRIALKGQLVENRRQSRQLAFALGGGGARGALQVGALRALYEAGIRPDFLAGTSIGAVNAVFLAMHGYTFDALDRLEDAWMAAAAAEIFPTNMTWLALRVFFNRPQVNPYQRLRDFFISQGVTPDLRFGDLPHYRVVLVSADLNSCQHVTFGDPEEFVLDGLLASTALPPWVHPIELDSRLLVDGGVVSNVPIEPAIAHGAGEVIAFRLVDLTTVTTGTNGLGPFLWRFLSLVETRQIYLEQQLAAAKHTPVHLVALKPSQPTSAWDFSHTRMLFDDGYRQMHTLLAAGEISLARSRAPWLERLKNWLSHRST